MAVAPTGRIFKCLEFDGESSRNYGVYITGEAVFNAPERAVEMVAIPYRNGAFALDKGYFENIEVTYHAGIFADSESDFAEAVAAFRNFLCSKKGYCRLTDDYNSDEYRMAIYKSGLEVTPATLKAGELDIVFDCKPQRWLTSGESEISVSDGNMILNPTLFESKPLLEVEGYGAIGFNGYAIELSDDVFGEITLLSRAKKSVTGSSTNSITGTFDSAYVRTGDTITLDSEILSNGEDEDIGSMTSSCCVYCDAAYSLGTVTTQKNNLAFGLIYRRGQYPNRRYFDAYLNSATFTAGTAQTVTGSLVGQFPVLSNGTTVETVTVTNTLTVEYDGNGTILAVSSVTISGDTLGAIRVHPSQPFATTVSEVVADSSASVLGHPTYIDCDLGEAYMVKDGSVISLDRYIDLGSNLPTLGVGTNVVSFDSTITDLKIIPRWWQV